MKNLRLKARIVLMYGTQEDFAAVTKDKPSFVSHVIANRRPVSRATKARYAMRLECKVEDIFED